MIAQVTLIPAESKKLISIAVAKMELLQLAQQKGMVVLHPSSSTYFIVEALTGHKPRTNVWTVGIITPKGACVEMASTMAGHPIHTHSWIVKQGEFSTGRTLDSLLEEMGPNDVFIKGANALDATNTAGVLSGNPSGFGTVARAMAAAERKGFKMIFPVGLEKLVPFSIKEAAKHTDRKKVDYSMGIPCNLFPCEGIVVTELRAVEILSGATAIPIAAGGLGGAEGAITMIIEGSDPQVSEAIKYVEQAKGASLPQVRTNDCYQCGWAACKFPILDKHWA